MKEFIKHMVETKRTFLSALAGAVIGALPIAYGIGQYIGSHEQTWNDATAKIERHVLIEMPTFEKRLREAELVTVRYDEKIKALTDNLQDVKEQNGTILRMLTEIKKGQN